MKAKTLKPPTAAPRRRGWRLRANMPPTGSPEWGRFWEELGPPAAYRHMSDWPRRTPEEREKISREFKEPTADEINTFRLRHAIPKDWKIIPCAGSWVVESPLWPRTRPTPQSHLFGFVRIYNTAENIYDQFVVETLELAGYKPRPGQHPSDHD